MAYKDAENNREYQRAYYQSLTEEEKKARVEKQLNTYYKNRAAKLGMTVEEYMATKKPRKKRNITARAKQELAKQELAEQLAEQELVLLQPAPATDISDIQEEHSLISPSSVERVYNCPASVVLTKDLPDVTSEAASEGTVFHACMEDLLKNPPKDEMELKSRLNELESMEMMGYVEDAYNYISNILIKLKPIIVDVERKVPIFYSATDFGTLDLGFVVPTKQENHYHIVILDWKYGKGHYVEVDHNKQIASYAYSYYLDMLKDNEAGKFIVDKITTIIYQPRCKSLEGLTARACSYTVPELEEFCRAIRYKVSIAYKLLTANSCEVSKEQHAGEHCLFCKLKAQCVKHKEYITKDALDLIQDLTPDTSATSATSAKENVGAFKEISLLTEDDMIRIVSFGETILPKLKSYIEEVSNTLQRRLEAGEKIEGLKLVQGKGRRKWVDDENKIIETLESVGIDCTKTTLKTLTEVEAGLKLIGRKDLLDSLVVMSEGKARVTLETNKANELSTTLISDL